MACFARKVFRDYRPISDTALAYNPGVSQIALTMEVKNVLKSKGDKETPNNDGVRHGGIRTLANG